MMTKHSDRKNNMNNMITMKTLNKTEQLGDYIEKSMNPVTNWLKDDGSGLWDAEIKAFLDSETLKGLFFSEAWVYILVDLVANKIASRRMKVFKNTVEDGKIGVEPVDDHPLNTMLDRPNDLEGYSTFMYRLAAEHTLICNSIVWSKSGGELILLRTERVMLDFEKDGGIKSYIFFPEADFEFINGKTKTLEFDPEDIIHTKRPNLNSMIWGLSPFIPGRKSILFDRYSQDYLNSFYLKQAIPGLALEMDQHVHEDVALRLLRTLEMAHTGRKNQRRSMLLPKG